MAIGDQASNNVDETVDGATMAGMLNLRYVLELIDYTFNDGSFTQKQFVQYREQAILHVFAEFRDELHPKPVQELFKEGLSDIATIRDQLAKQAPA